MPALYSPGGLNLADTTAPLILAYDDTGTTDVVFAVSASGDLTITPDGGDVTVSGTMTVTSTLTLTKGSQNYLFTDDGSNLAVQSQTAATTGGFCLFTKDGDGTDSFNFRLFAVGLPGSTTNNERLNFKYKSSSQIFELMTSSGGTGTVRPFHIYTGANTSQIVLAIDGSTSFGGAVSIGATAKFYLDGGGNSYIQESSADNVILVTGGTEAFQIGSDQKVTFRGAISLEPTKKLHFDGGADTYILENSANVLRCVAGGSGGVDLLSGGTSWTAVSDERLKKIIEPIEGALEGVGRLRSVIGRYKTDDISRRRSFLIAQDVQKVLPEAVTEGEDGMLNLSYTDLIPLLVAAINELEDEVSGIRSAAA